VRDQIDQPDWDEETFRTNVESSLSVGNFILMIVVDEITDGLARIVRYMNSSGSPAFAFAALEMRRFQASTTEMLVPKVFGDIRRPASSPPTIKKQWDEPSFFTDMGERHPDCVDAARRILNWAQDQKNIARVWWGAGSRTGSFVPVVSQNGYDHALFAVYTYGRIEIYFYWYQYKPVFDSEAKRIELLNRLNAIPGVKIPADAIARRPSIPLTIFNNPQALQDLLKIFDWFIRKSRRVDQPVVSVTGLSKRAH
jgi:hypothetical protein